MITLLGLMANLLALFVFQSYDTTATKEIPLWLAALFSCCLFIYQTMDAIDGKQARRTGSSSPLGQLFDHGCDAITTSVVISMFCQATLLGRE